MITSKIIKGTLLTTAMVLVFSCVNGDVISDPKTHLVAYYPFNGNANDQSGNGNHGAVFGDAALAADRDGNANSAYRFDGEGGGIWVNQGASLKIANFEDGYTLAAWIKPSGKTPDYQNIIAKQFSRPGFPPNMHAAFLLRMNKNRIQAGHLNPDGSEIVFTGSRALSYNTWYHVAVSWKNSTPNVWDVYVNAKKDPGSGGMAKGLFSGGTDGGVAAGHYRLHESIKWTFNGTIDEVRIYKSALAQAEVQQIMSEADSDGDGIIDNLDNCPNDYNPGQEDGDSDGFGDICDVCPREAEDDVDADGICAKKDNCPEVFNPGNPQPDMDADGLGNACDPDADADGFGHVNFSDICCDDYWAVYDGKTGKFIRVYNEDDPLAAGEIRGGDCDDGDPSVLPDRVPCPAQANAGKPEDKPGGNPNTKDEDKDGKPDKQETDSPVKLTDTFKSNADSDGDNISDGSEDPDDTGGPITTGPDNCPRTPKADQTNTDGDAAEPIDAVVGMATKGGDACDTDMDNDGLADKRLDSIDASGQLVFQDIPNTPNGDNCPLAFNPDQMNSDADQLGDACDPDADNDGFCEESLCPDKDKVYTFDPRTGVVSATTTAYTTGQTLGPNEVRGGDCDDTDENINPGETEQPDGQDNDCDPGTPDSAHAIQTQVTVTKGDGTPFNCSTSGGHPCANWMPVDGDTITLTASVSGATNVAVNFNVEEVTRLPGKYLNDASEKHLLPPNPNDPCTACAQDFAITGTTNQRVLTCRDYGAYIRIRLTAEHPAGSPLVPVIISFPKDNNTNYIADEWEQLLAPELAAAQSIDPSITGFAQNGDKDYILVDAATGELNSTRGDGITDQFEYRGAKWGPGVIDPVNPATGLQHLVKTTSGPGQLYRTPTYLPMGTAGHFRMNPFRPDVFIKFYNYSVIKKPGNFDPTVPYTPPNPLEPGDLESAASCGVGCPFALGTALVDGPKGAGVDVHVVRAEAAAGQPEAVGEENIDVLVMTNDTTNTYGSETGHILRFGKRSWLTGTLGDCPVGTGTGYGPVIDADPCRTFTIAIGYWYKDVPYRDGGRDYTDPRTNKNKLLDAVNNRNRVEDKDDDGIRDGGENSIVNDEWLDGDCYLRNDIASGNYMAGELTTFDIDQDGLIEMPTLFGPDDLATAKEYSTPHAFKVITTHEAIHGLGVGHTQASTCLMFANVNELDKDDNLSPDAKRDLDIFNGRPTP